MKYVQQAPLLNIALAEFIAAEYIEAEAMFLTGVYLSDTTTMNTHTHTHTHTHNYYEHTPTHTQPHTHHENAHTPTHTHTHTHTNTHTALHSPGWWRRIDCQGGVLVYEPSCLVARWEASTEPTPWRTF